jgi:hypothetical protein
VNVLEGKQAGAISTAGGAVTLDLRPLLERIQARLGIADKVRPNAPPDAGQIVLLRPDQLDAAQKTVQAVRVLSVFLAIAVLALYALAIFLARGRRRLLLQVSGASILFAGLVLLAVRRLVGDAIVDALVKTEAGKPPVHTIWLIETALLRDIAVGLVVYGLVAIIAGWLGGASRPAVAIRRFLAPTFRQRPVLVHAVAAMIFLIIIAWGPIAGSRRLIGIVVLAALIGFGLEVWRRQTVREFPAGPAAPPEEPEFEAQKPALT